ncbi:hypothetical protein AB1Y20_005042 [Prymnesium parvum]|uniref:Signal recognition particle SRP54 subunit M-domain domain-containing protein n=1 Tax=Prymnesium parvum TaxID=97485 RepID=A0AB34J5D7_PRYPA|mmetsp:Transcript_9609/g.23848  ORF Transcript_9609/g.23848 Transcript_9609/m.23848 type:complete len:238 (-) Transcript_9609:440-1153(-)
MLSCALLSLGLATARLPSNALAAHRRGPLRPPCTMQMPNFGNLGSKLMEQMGLGEGSGLTKEESEAMEARLKTGEMSFDDFLKQVKVMQKAGNVQAMLKNGPFGSGPEAAAQLKEGERKLSRYASYVEVMESEDRNNPSLLIEEAKLVRGGAPPNRLKKLAEAAGTSIDEVGQFVTEFALLRKAAVAFANGEDPNKVRAMMEEEQQASRPPMNRQMRRQMAKKKKKASSSSGGFGRR